MITTKVQIRKKINISFAGSANFNKVGKLPTLGWIWAGVGDATFAGENRLRDPVLMEK